MKLIITLWPNHPSFPWQEFIQRPIHRNGTKRHAPATTARWTWVSPNTILFPQTFMCCGNRCESCFPPRNMRADVSCSYGMDNEQVLRRYILQTKENATKIPQRPDGRLFLFSLFNPAYPFDRRDYPIATRFIRETDTDSFVGRNDFFHCSWCTFCGAKKFQVS